MAQSIFVTLETLETETSVPAINKTVQHTLPRAMFPTAQQFESEEMLVAWARETGCLHACLQKGVQAKLIDARATFKAVKKGETWTVELGQKNVDGMKWEAAERPKQGEVAKIKAERAQAELTAGINMANAMHINGVDKALIMASLTPVYGVNVARTIVDSLTN